jgi:hypothetical protein
MRYLYSLLFFLPAEDEAAGTNVAAGPWEIRDRVRRNIKFNVDLIQRWSCSDRTPASIRTATTRSSFRAWCSSA